MLNQLLDWIMTVKSSPSREGIFCKVAQLAITKNVAMIVETGTCRNRPVDGMNPDGASTLILSNIAAYLGAKIISVDTDKQKLDSCENMVAEYTKQPWRKDTYSSRFVCADSVTYLSEYCGDKIGLLYLDSYDFDSVNPGPSQRHQLAELGAVWGKLSEDAIIHLDDCHLPFGGKGGLSVPFLEDRGAKPFPIDETFQGIQKIFTLK